MGERGPKSQFSDISCPNTECRMYGITGRENIVGNGTYKARGRMSQRYCCKVCGHYFNSGTDTAYDGIRSDQDKFDLAIRCMNDGMGVRATARTVGCSVSTVQRWRARASARAAMTESRSESSEPDIA